MYVSPSILHTLRERGELGDNVLLHSCSIDRPFNGYDTKILADTLTTPAPDITPQASEDTTKWVEALLAGLTERQRQLLSLRYGLDPADAREHTNIEIAQMLNLSETNVCETLQRAINACRRIYEHTTQGAACPPQQQLREQHPPHRYVEPHNEKMAHKRLEQYEKLQAAFASLRAQEQRITSHTLSAAAHVDSRVAREFLRTYGTQRMNKNAQVPTKSG